MSLTETTMVDENLPDSKKRKREANEEDLEIDINAPEPPSKKALRKAKKNKSTNTESTEKPNERPKEKLIGAEDVVPNSGKRSEYGIWIGNLSFTTTKQDLLDFMTGDQQFAIAKDQVTRINLPAGPAKFGKFQNKGFAYIDLADAEALKSALQLSEKLLTGRRVLIKNANNFEGRPKETKKEAPGHPPSKRIFIGNLDFETTVEDLEKHFGVCGPIQHTQLATFEDSGKCKGYAWVDFEQLSSGQAAMRGWVEEGTQDSNNDVKRSKQRIWVGKINGRKLRMEYAEDKTTRYNKRFGKNAAKDSANDTEPAIAEVINHDRSSKDSGKSARNGQSISSTKHSSARGDRGRKQRYTDDTVKRLTGAIVEGQGQKVTFD